MIFRGLKNDDLMWSRRETRRVFYVFIGLYNLRWYCPNG